MKQLLLIFSFICSIIVANAQKHADLYHTGVFYRSYTTIDSAIRDAYYVGDSIVLSPHTFYEKNIGDYSKNIAYKGTMTATDTSTIDGLGAQSVALTMRCQGSIRDIIIQNFKGFAIDGPTTTDTVYIGGNMKIRNIDSVKCVINLANICLLDNVQIVNCTVEQVLTNPRIVLKDNVLIGNNRIYSSLASITDHRRHKVSTITCQNCRITGKVKIMNNTADSNSTAGISIVNTGSNYVIIGDSVTIQGNKTLSVGQGRGGAIYIWNLTTTTSSPRTINIGAMTFSDNQSDQGGAIYCDDSLVTLSCKGTNFINNKAKKGGAIYSRGSLDVSRANFVDNQADSGSAIYIDCNPLPGGSSYAAVYNSRFYNSKVSSKKQDHIYATYKTGAAIPPSVSINANWWGKSDTIGVLRENPKGLSSLAAWAKANWTVKGGSPVVKTDTSFAVQASLKDNSGGTFPASSFTALQGTFTADTGTFTPVTAKIDASNNIISTYKTFKTTGASMSAGADIVAWVDADTFRKTVVVWSNTAIAELKQSLPQVAVYPNPAKDFLTIENASQGSTIALFDLTGKQVFRASAKGNNDMIDMSILQTGVYLLKITDPDGNEGSAKVVKE